MTSHRFNFKQFSIKHENSAMKIGTDGVLLGAWAKPNPTATRVLDVGTGTGLIALMLAQRFSAFQIDAVEIEQGAVEEARFNFEASKWANRLNSIHQDFKLISEQSKGVYDFVVCNPPFFKQGFPIKENTRAQARDESHLPFDVLCAKVRYCLKDEGAFALILPQQHAEAFIAIAQTNHLHLNYSTLIRGHQKAPVKRVLMQFSTSIIPLQTNTLVLEEKRNVRTLAHQKLVQAFYL